MLLLMLVLGFLLASVLVSAQHQVSGIGRLSSGSTDDVQFNLDVYASAVNGIISSVNNGPNRTTSQCFPVEKLYGVNVRVIFPVLLKGQPCFRLATGWYPKHGSFEYVLDIGS
jgi:hypothetical protein